jgi:hypothetical protein
VQLGQVARIIKVISTPHNWKKTPDCIRVKNIAYHTSGRLHNNYAVSDSKCTTENRVLKIRRQISDIRNLIRGGLKNFEVSIDPL